MTERQSLTLLCVLIDVAGLLLGLALLFRMTPRGHERWWRELVTFTGFGLLLGLVAVLAADALLDDHGAMVRAACHVLFCVLAPLLIVRGAFVLAALRGGLLRLTGALFVLTGLGMEAVYLHARNVAPYDLQTSRHVVESPRLRGLDAPLRIAVVADVHAETIGAHERGLFARIAAERPDLLLLLGDHVHRPHDEPDEYRRALDGFRELLAGLQPPPRFGIWAIDGDSEWQHDCLRPMARTLIDEAQVIPLGPGGPGLQILGLDNGTSHQHLQPPHRALVDGFPGFTIVLGHAPDFMNAVLQDGHRPDALYLAGHCHGGQIQVPGYGPPPKLATVPRSWVAGGMQRQGATWCLISRGVGVERGHMPPLRLFCPPELVVLELRAAP